MKDDEAAAYTFGRIARADGWNRQRAIELGAELGHQASDVGRGHGCEPTLKINAKGRFTDVSHG